MKTYILFWMDSETKEELSGKLTTSKNPEELIFTNTDDVILIEETLYKKLNSEL